MNSCFPRLKVTVMLGIVGGIMAWTAQPASAGLFTRRVIIVESPTVVAMPTATVAPAPVVVSSPVPTVYTAPAVVSGPVRAVYNAPIVPTTTYSGVVPTVYSGVVPTVYSGVVPTVYGTSVVVRPVERVKVVYPRRVYRYSY